MAMNQRPNHSNTGNKPPFGVYLSATIIIFVLTLSVADSLGLVPDYIDGTQSEHLAYTDNSMPVSNLPELGEQISPVSAPVVETVPVATAKPVTIIIPSIDMNLPDGCE